MNKKIILSTVALAMLISLFTMCKKDEPVVMIEGNIQVIVKDYESHEAISGALITVSGIDKVFKTNSKGEYLISNIKEGYYNITVSQTAYVSDMSKVEIDAGKTTKVYFELKKEQAKLKVIPNDLDFGTDKKQMFFTLINENKKAKMRWEIIVPKNTKWLSISKSKGVLSDGDEKIRVSVDRSKMSEEKVYATYLTVKTANGGSATVQIRVNKILPKLKVLPKVLDFSTKKTRLTINIENVHSSVSLNWLITKPENVNWLRLSKYKGSDLTTSVETVTVEVDREKMKQAKVYTAYLTIKSTNGLGTAKVQVRAKKILPKLKVTPIILDFENNKTQMTFDIENAQPAAPLNWVIDKADDADWLSFSKNEGQNLTNGKESITVTVDRDKMTEDQDYQTYLEISSSNGGVGSIKVEIKASKVLPKLQVSSEVLDFGTTKTQMTFNIENSHSAAPLNWVIDKADDADWLSFSKNEGQNLTNGVENITVTVDRDKMIEATDYTTRLTITSTNGGGSATVDIKANKMLPSIDVNTHLLFFRDSNKQYIEISNINSSAPMNWIITNPEGVDWFSLSKTEGENLTTGKEKVTITIDRNKMTQGKDYTTYLIVQSTNGGGSIRVKLKVEKKEEIKFLLEPTYLDFSEQNELLTLKLRNLSQNKMLYYKASSSFPWITIGNNEGSINVNGLSEIQVRVDRSGLKSGSYNGKVQIAINNKLYVVPVKMTVVQKVSTLVVERNTLNFGTKTQTYNFQLGNTSPNSSIYYKISNYESWIQLDHSTGSIDANGTANLRIKVVRNGLSPGQYSGKIYVVSNKQVHIVNIIMTVAQNTAATLRLQTNNLNFGTQYSTYDFPLRNMSSDTKIYYEATSDKSWIQLSNSYGNIYANGTKNLGIKVVRSGLSSGEYSGHIYIVTNQKTYVVNVRMTVEEQGGGSSTINSGLSLEGKLGFTIEWGKGRVNMRADKVINNRPNGHSGTLKLQLRMGKGKFKPGVGSSYNIGEYRFKETLDANEYYYDIDHTVKIKSYPPRGNYYVTMVLLEYDDGEYYVVDYFTFKETLWVN